MLLPESDQIQVEPYYRTMSTREFLGYLLVDDVDQHGYYTVSNSAPNPVCERVSPVFGEYNDTVMTDLECWYEKPTYKGMRENDALQHEYYRDEYLERLSTHKYCVWFMGCDDGDKFMRFESKESAIEFLNNIELFDEIDDHPHCQMW